MKHNQGFLPFIWALLAIAFNCSLLGATPPALRYDGAYSSAKHYAGGDIVTSGSDIYEAVSHFADGVTPGTNSSVWIPLTFTDPNGVLPNESTAIGSQALELNTGVNNTALGEAALENNTTGTYNTASGAYALQNNTIGVANTAEGDQALQNNTTGYFNMATGEGALQNNTTGFENTASGQAALYSNTTGFNNAADGFHALQNNTIGVANTADGAFALQENTTGDNNTGIGNAALNLDTTGSNNSANGAYALQNNVIGCYNVANGAYALENNTGSYNAGDGAFALQGNTTGFNNVATGVGALQSNTTGSGNIGIGCHAGTNLTSGSENIDIGDFNETTDAVDDLAGESNTIRIGETTVPTQTATYIAGIINETVASGAQLVYIDANGKLGTVVAGVGSIDTRKIGTAIANLVTENARLEERNSKLIASNTKLEAAFAQQQQEITVLMTGLKEQASLLQKVSTKIQLTRPAPQVVSNND